MKTIILIFLTTGLLFLCLTNTSGAATYLVDRFENGDMQAWSSSVP